MSSLAFLIPITLILVVIAIIGFCYAVKSDQFDDLEQEASRILFDEPKQPSDKKTD
jgi:cbb3-type cytochrome oxidase maturation protein